MVDIRGCGCRVFVADGMYRRRLLAGAKKEMIRYGIKTWKRIALPAVLFLGLAVFWGISAWQIHHSVHKEMAAYGKIMCTLDDTTDSEMAQALFYSMTVPVYMICRSYCRIRMCKRSTALLV